MVLPEEGSLIETVEWGVVPVDLVDVLLVDGSGTDHAEKVAEAIGGEIVGSIELIAFYQIKIEGATEADLTAALALAEAQPSVEMASPELPMVADGEASCVAQGPLQNSWFADAAEPANAKPYQAVGLEQAWAAVRASGVTLAPTKVGVVDTALYTGSGELAGTVRITGVTAADTTDKPASDASGALTFGGLNHGTGVAHVIGADPSNGGMVGVASVLGEKLEISISKAIGGPGYVAAAPNPDDLTQIDYGAGGAWTSSILAGMLNQVKQGEHCHQHLPRPEETWCYSTPRSRSHPPVVRGNPQESPRGGIRRIGGEPCICSRWVEPGPGRVTDAQPDHRGGGGF